MHPCNICPRSCNVNRDVSRGYCGCGDDMQIACTMFHKWEEPCICHGEGCGAIFFTGCSLRCIYCQNSDISQPDGKNRFRTVTAEELSDIMLKFQEGGASCIDLVSPTHYTEQIIPAVKDARKLGLVIPVVWNTGGYERKETVRMLEGVADIFLTDFKYVSSSLSERLSAAPDYFGYASAALREMIRITGGTAVTDGRMSKGVIVRHLILPGQTEDSMNVLKFLSESGIKENILLALMAQYTPECYLKTHGERAGIKQLDDLGRKLTTFEYRKVMDLAQKLDFNGYFQSKGSSGTTYIPHWGEYVF